MKKHKASEDIGEADLSGDHKQMMEAERAIDLELEKAEQEFIKPKERETKNKWDGSESGFVENDDEKGLEASYSGIKLQYALKKEEIIACLNHCNNSKHFYFKKLVQIVAIGIISVFFLNVYFFMQNFSFLFLSLVSVLFLILISLFPVIELGIKAKKLAQGAKINVEIYPEEIEIEFKEKAWTIPLDGTVFFEEIENMWILFLPHDKIFAIPLRAIDPDFLAETQAMLVSGTTPFED